MSIGKEDELETLIRQAIQRETRNFWWAICILVGLHYAGELLPRLFGLSTSVRDLDRMLLLLGLLTLMREFLGYKGQLIELRFRTIKLKEQLTTIEETLNNHQKDFIERRN